MGIKDLLKNLAQGLYDGERTDSEMNNVSSGLYIDQVNILARQSQVYGHN